MTDEKNEETPVTGNKAHDMLNRLAADDPPTEIREESFDDLREEEALVNEAQAPATEPEYVPPENANVALSKNATDKALNEGKVSIGMKDVDIPSKEAQIAGFYTEHAGELVAQFPQFKFKQRKGTPTQSVKI